MSSMKPGLKRPNPNQTETVMPQRMLQVTRVYSRQPASMLKCSVVW